MTQTETFELVELDTDGNEVELICTGTFADLIAARDEKIETTEDDGYDWPILVIQPASE